MTQSSIAGDQTSRPPYFTARGTETEPLCFLCGEAVGRIEYDYPDMKIIRCNRCGLWRSCPRYSAAELDVYYEKHHYSGDIRGTGKYEEWRDKHTDVWLANAEMVGLEALKRGFGKAPKLLDVGSGHGFFLEQCRVLGIQGRGIEVSPHAVKYSREELKLDVRQIPLDELPADEKYDVITMWGVLEHVPNPLITMSQVCAHLNPNGMAWVMTPNTNALDRRINGANWFNFINKSHLTHFHRRTLKALMERAGLKNVHRYIHFGGGGRKGLGAGAQYAARWLCLGTELRFVGEK